MPFLWCAFTLYDYTVSTLQGKAIMYLPGITHEHSYIRIRPSGTLYRRINEIQSEQIRQKCDETIEQIVLEIKRKNELERILKEKNAK